MRKAMTAMLAIMLLMMGCVPAGAEKARGIATEADEVHHISHLQQHLNSVNCRVTGNYIKVRTEAETNAKVIGHLEQADEFVLLERCETFARIRVLSSHETSPDSWSGMEGWVTAIYVDCTCNEEAYRANQGANNTLMGGYFPASMPSNWYFASGAGGWSTEMTIQEDGTFTGYYHDWDAYAEDEEAYPCGSLQECYFTGRFSSPERISAYEYRVVVTELTQEGMPGETFARDGQQVTISTAYGIGQGDSFIIYLPGTPLNRIPPVYSEWAYVVDDGWHTRAFALYNMTDAFGWNEGE